MKLKELLKKVPVDNVIRDAIIDTGITEIKKQSRGKTSKNYSSDLAEKVFELEVTSELANSILKDLSTDSFYPVLKKTFVELGLIPKKPKNTNKKRYFKVVGYESPEIDEIDLDEYNCLKDYDYEDVVLIKSLGNLGSTKKGIPNLSKVLNAVDISTKRCIQIYKGMYLLVDNVSFRCSGNLEPEISEEEEMFEGLDVFYEEELKSILYNEKKGCLDLRIPLEKYMGLDESIKDRIDYFLEKNFSFAYLKYDSNTKELIISGDMFLY